MKDIKVCIINKKETYDYILNKHYAGRKPSISFSYGLFIKGKIEGICTLGKPASNSLCEGVLGKEYKNKVYELNRLVTEDNLPSNSLSYFVSKVLKELKKLDLILVSYADSGMNHCGYIYQATNWIYTGKTKERTDKFTEGNKHSRHYKNENNHLRKLRTSKYRYIYFTGKSKKEYIKLLKYSILPYPKEENKNYILGEKQKTKVINKDDDSFYFV